MTNHFNLSRLVLGVVQPRHVDPVVNIPGAFEPPPKDRLIRCFIVKDRITQAYCLFLQLNKELSNNINWGKFLLAARPVTSVAYSEFIIYGDLPDFTDQREFYYGRLRSNLTHTAYTLWDCRQSERRESRTSCWSQSSAGLARSSKVADIRNNVTFGKPQKLECVVHTVRYGAVLPDAAGASSGDNPSEAPDIWTAKSMRSSELPRQVSRYIAKSVAGGAGQIRKPYLRIGKILQSVAKLESSDNRLKRLNTLPRGSEGPLESSSSFPEHDRSVKSRTSLAPGNGMAKKKREAKVADAVVDVPLHMETMAYTRDKTGKRYCAQFNRADIRDCAKNFQLVSCNPVQEKNDKILLQFGQSGPEIFFMDYSYPLTAFLRLLGYVSVNSSKKIEESKLLF